MNDVSLNIFDVIQALCVEFRAACNADSSPTIDDYLVQVHSEARETLFRNLLPIDIRYRERGGNVAQYEDYANRFPRYKRAIADAFRSSVLPANDDTCGNPTVEEGLIALQPPSSAESTLDHGPSETIGKTLDPAQQLLMTDKTLQYAPLIAGDETLDPTTLHHVSGPPTVEESLAVSRIGNYALVRELGRGGFGVVYEAIHGTHRTRLALKTLPTGVDGQEGNAQMLHEFRREFRSLAEVNHPNLVGMQSLEVDGSQWFFTMDLVKGVDFLSYVRPGGVLDQARLRSALRQLVDGVLGLHERRILHRDLKPSNVLVSPDGHVSILDFGLVAELERRTDQPDSVETQHFAGTPRYAAPEQISGQLSAATDWYAVGTMLFEALVGKAPFEGTAMQILIKKSSSDPPKLFDSAGLPDDLKQLADGLLERDPERRPTTQQLIDAVGLTTDRLASHASRSWKNEAGGAASSAVTDSLPLIGREEQLKILAGVKQVFSEQHRPQVVWISGLSGEGKSTLADKFLDSFRAENSALILSGRCYDRESVPYKAVDVLVEALVGFLCKCDQDRIAAWLPRDIQMLARLFPILRRVETIEQQPRIDLSSIDDRQIRYRGFYALGELLVSISREFPMVVFIDDLQWGDADSAEALVDILTGDDPPAIFLLGSYRSDEADQSPFLQEWSSRSSQHLESLSGIQVEVAPLTETQCLEYIAQTIGLPAKDLSEDARELLADTKGNPYFLEQFIEGFNAKTGRFEPTPLREVIERKLSRLPAQARDLLTAIAIAGQAVSIEESSAVAGHDSSLYSIVTPMRSERLVRLIGSDGVQYVDTYHDKIRETRLASLIEAERQHWHLRFGEELERIEQVDAASLLRDLSSHSDARGGQVHADSMTRIYDLAYHFYASKDSRGFVYQLLAGEQALRNFASEEALVYFDRAKKLVPSDATSRLQYRLWMGLGRVYLWNRQPEHSIAAYEQAKNFANCDFEKAQACSGVVKAHSQTGLFDNAIAEFDRASEFLNKLRPRRAISKTFFILKTLFEILCIPSKYLRDRAEHDREAASLQMEMCVPLACFIPEKSFIDTIVAYLKSSREALRVGDPQSVAQAYAQCAFVLSGFGVPWGGNLLLRRAKKIEVTLDDPGARGAYLQFEGVARYWGSDLPNARASLAQSLPLLGRAGNFYNQMVAAHMLRHTHAFISSASDEEMIARKVLRIAQQTSNIQCTCWGKYDVASALSRRGQFDEALEQMKATFRSLTDEAFQMTEAIRAATYGYVLLQASQYLAARESAVEGWGLVLKCPIDVTMFNLPVLIESIVGPQWMSPFDPSDRSLVRRLLRRATIVGLSYPNHKPHLQRVSGRALWSLGLQRQAIRKFEKSIQVATSKGMDYQHARCLLDLAAVQEKNREQNRAEAIELLKRMESVIPRAEAWQLGEQYDETVVAPKFDFDGWERKHGSVRTAG